MKIDNYCIALIVLILFLIYVDNTNNIEGYGEIGQKPVIHKEVDRGYGDAAPVNSDKVVQDYEAIGQKPTKVTMESPSSMNTSMGMLTGAPVNGTNFMLLDKGVDVGVYDVIGADLPETHPRVGSPDNLGKDSSFVSQLLQDDSAIRPYEGDVLYQELGSTGELAGPYGAGDDRDDDGPPGGGPLSSGDEMKVTVIYAPWCGWSKKSLPDFNKMDAKLNGLASSETNGWNVSAEVYDSDTPEGKDKVKEYDVDGFPTVIVEVNGQKQDGPREYNEMIELVNQTTGSKIN